MSIESGSGFEPNEQEGGATHSKLIDELPQPMQTHLLSLESAEKEAYLIRLAAQMIIDLKEQVPNDPALVEDFIHDGPRSKEALEIAGKKFFERIGQHDTFSEDVDADTYKEAEIAIKSRNIKV